MYTTYWEVSHDDIILLLLCHAQRTSFASNCLRRDNLSVLNLGDVGGGGGISFIAPRAVWKLPRSVITSWQRLYPSPITSLTRTSSYSGLSNLCLPAGMRPHAASHGRHPDKVLCFILLRVQYFFTAFKVRAWTTPHNCLLKVLPQRVIKGRQ